MNTVQILDEETIITLQQTGVWKPTCVVPLARLRKVVFSYIDFTGKTHTDGEIIVLDAVASSVQRLFHTLYHLQFPLHSAKCCTHYNGDDEASMEANNSSAFNDRIITGGSQLSLHSYGLAIDINPLQNPYLATNDKMAKEHGMVKVLPREGVDYLNRTVIRPGMVEPIVSVFAEHGFSIWGGAWNQPIDWQHFQVSRAAAQLMVIMSSEHAEQFFRYYMRHPHLFNALPSQDERFMAFYQQHPTQFMAKLHTNPSLLGLPVEEGYHYLTSL